ncbi:ABC transporter ATP-binding protein [Carboxydochorda subterranea]|uniref:ABC transporter ATP-binding protein n=1 Tax=Carboxydichorda subterranea TaxID=3109565 RepID=A0ABZ1BUF1_9FIRM|nr:ABC transporter ATP-binding protein [Limnochorda sp. L945t]WRP16397.1 ABC transporter ATP-binding protein [Limnochorda sp. L945t]
MEPLLSIDKLRVNFYTHAGTVHAVRGASFEVREGETLALVGESGCGKSVTALSIMRLVPHPGRIDGGTIRFAGKELTALSLREMERVRGAEIGMIFQDPMTSLNPTMTIGQQIAEPLRKHKGMGPKEALDRAAEILAMVGIPNPRTRLAQFPHEMSGGMRQRVMIAMAIACEPHLLIADEPTTSLDVTIQAQILELMKGLQEKLGMAILLITHDLGVVARLADRVVVMYAGQVVEQAGVDELYYHTLHPYTRALMRSVPNPEAGVRQELESIAGSPPDLYQEPPGCPFAPRCSRVLEVCRSYPPPFFEAGPEHVSACWLLDPRAGRWGKDFLATSPRPYAEAAASPKTPDQEVEA